MDNQSAFECVQPVVEKMFGALDDDVTIVNIDAPVILRAEEPMPITTQYLLELEKVFPEYTPILKDNSFIENYISQFPSKDVNITVYTWSYHFIKNYVKADLESKYPQHKDLWKDPLFVSLFDDRFATEPAGNGYVGNWFYEVITEYRKQKLRLCVLCPNCEISVTSVSLNHVDSKSGLVDPILCPLCKVLKSEPVSKTVNYIVGGVGSLFSGVKNILYKK
jgi:hypothetical protein